MKKIISLFLAAAMLFACLLPASAQEAAAEKPPVEIKAKAAVLMDVSTGKILISHNEHEQLYPASVTKIMPLLLFMEAIAQGKMNLADTVTASPTAAAKGGSQIWLKEGEQMTVDELLRACAIASANDACEALGEHLAGSEEGFVAMLNERAGQLGMKDTHFDNCTGLDDTTDTHLTSAHDVAIMSAELLRYELIQKYTTVWMDSLRNGATELVNTNKLVRFYNGTTGLKTGTTSKAGCCVSASAQREGTHLVAVVMGSSNSDDRFGTAKAMLNWGFANYESVTPQIDTSLMTDVSVIGGCEETITPRYEQPEPILIRKGDFEKVKQEVELCVDVTAPVEKGQRLGTVRFKLGDEILGEYPLFSGKAVDELKLFEVIRRLFSSLSGNNGEKKK